MLVAPVVEKGVKSRRIYFPEGSWLDMNNKDKMFNGPQWVDYDVELKTIPYFEVKSSSYD